jgi:hypothetical protein
MVNPIPIVPDIPDSNPHFGFMDYTEALANAVRGVFPAQLTIGIYGPWGSGKTSLLRSVAKSLGRTDGVIPVLFDAWRYEESGPIIIPLLYQVLKSFKDEPESPVARQIKKLINALLASISIDLPGVKIDGSKLSESMTVEDSINILDAAFARPYEELSKLTDRLGSRRICVLIDDLDRCSPRNLVTTLEAINLVLDTPGIVFIIALDYDVLAEAIALQYPHVSAHLFIEKIIQLPFRVPPHELPKKSFMTGLVPQEALSGLPDDFLTYSYEIATLALGSNLRQIKRFINSFLVLKFVAERRQPSVDYQLLAALVGLQLGWPARHSELARSLLIGSEMTVNFAKSKDPRLITYAERFFVGVDSRQFEQSFRLTQIIPQNIEPPRVALEQIDWQVASRQMLLGDGGVAVGKGGNQIFINDNKTPAGGVLAYGSDAWKEFIDKIRKIK